MTWLATALLGLITFRFIREGKRTEAIGMGIATALMCSAGVLNALL